MWRKFHEFKMQKTKFPQWRRIDIQLTISKHLNQNRELCILPKQKIMIDVPQGCNSQFFLP